MKTFNICIAIICSLFLFMHVSCNQENVGAEYTLANEGVTFLGTSTSITTTTDDTKVDYKIYRGNLNGRLEVAVNATYDKDVFTLPSSVVFEDGSNTAVFSIPTGKMIPFIPYSIVLTLDSAALSPSAKARTTINLKKEFVWEALKWEAFGTGQWTDGILVPIFGVPALSYPVKVEKSVDWEGLYRLVNPYGAGVYAYTEEGDVVRNPHYFVINAMTPNRVEIAQGGLLGIDYGYGEIFCSNYSNRYGARVDKTITFPAQTLAVGMKNYNNGNLSFLCGECVLVLP